MVYSMSIINEKDRKIIYRVNENGADKEYVASEKAFKENLRSQAESMIDKESVEGATKAEVRNIKNSILKDGKFDQKEKDKKLLELKTKETVTRIAKFVKNRLVSEKQNELSVGAFNKHIDKIMNYCESVFKEDVNLMDS